MGLVEGSVYVKHTSLGNDATIDGETELRLIVANTLVSVELPEQPAIRLRFLKKLAREVASAIVHFDEDTNEPAII